MENRTEIYAGRIRYEKGVLQMISEGWRVEKITPLPKKTYQVFFVRSGQALPTEEMGASSTAHESR
ncbi:MAG: hypothetical protein M3Q29_15635 [Chloroflexota bacterium]|nr:hypothetical protein [Chloroflexota bacterium]